MALPGGLGLGLDLLGFGTSLAGFFGANAAKKKAEQQRQQAIADLARSYDSEFQGTRDQNRTDLLATSGSLGDVLRNNGANLGAANANAGVYNSSAVAGSNTNLAATNAALLAKQSQQAFNTQQRIKDQGNQAASQYKIGFANQDYGTAQQNAGQALGAVGNSLSQTIGDATRSIGPGVNGSQGFTPIKTGVLGTQPGDYGNQYGSLYADPFSNGSLAVPGQVGFNSRQGRIG